MENLALLHSYIAHEDPNPAPQLRSLDGISLKISSSAWIGLTSLIVGLSILSISSQALAYIRYGNSGASVTNVQSVLSSLGYGVSVDGVFGIQTENAVIAFQRSQGLLADGIVGPATAGAMGINVSGGGGGGGGGPATGTVTVSTNGSPLNIRSGPGSGYGWLGSLSNGSSVGITGRVSAGWYELSSGGWIAGNWIVGGSGGGGGGGGGGAGFITVATNGSALNIRSGPGSGYGSLGALSNGTSASITGRVSNGWYELSSGGWVSGAWIY